MPLARIGHDPAQHPALLTGRGHRCRLLRDRRIIDPNPQQSSQRIDQHLAGTTVGGMAPVQRLRAVDRQLPDVEAEAAAVIADDPISPVDAGLRRRLPEDIKRPHRVPAAL